jgi:hypothetical protein
LGNSGSAESGDRPLAVACGIGAQRRGQALSNVSARPGWRLKIKERQ